MHTEETGYINGNKKTSALASSLLQSITKLIYNIFISLLTTDTIIFYTKFPKFNQLNKFSQLIKSFEYV